MQIQIKPRQEIVLKKRKISPVQIISGKIKYEWLGIKVRVGKSGSIIRFQNNN